jgi:hypothetical protein
MSTDFACPICFEDIRSGQCVHFPIPSQEPVKNKTVAVKRDWKPTDSAPKDKTYTAEEVKSILCEGCRKGLNDICEMGGDAPAPWYHTISGHQVPCTASDWRNRYPMVK